MSKLRAERLHLLLTLDELAALDEWRFARRMPSRSAAVRELMRQALAMKSDATAVSGVKSEAFGVLPRDDQG